jgi:hypothetical protein
VKIIIFISNQIFGWIVVLVSGVQVQSWGFHTAQKIAALNLMLLSHHAQTHAGLMVLVRFQDFTFWSSVLCGVIQSVPNAHQLHFKAYC